VVTICCTACSRTHLWAYLPKGDVLVENGVRTEVRHCECRPVGLRLSFTKYFCVRCGSELPDTVPHEGQKACDGSQESGKLKRMLLEWLLDRGGRDGEKAGEFIVPSGHGEMRLSVHGLTVLVGTDTDDEIATVIGKKADEVFSKLVSVVDSWVWP
jgi:hypothetical protein